MSVVISSGFRDIKLSDSSEWAEGRKRFFEDIMDALQQADEEWCASLVIGRKLEHAAAYFTAADCLITIVMPEGTVEFDENTKELMFADEDKWMCFVHEASHFMHLVVDGGKFISPSFEHLEPMVHAAFDGHRRSTVTGVPIPSTWNSRRATGLCTTTRFTGWARRNSISRGTSGT